MKKNELSLSFSFGIAKNGNEKSCDNSVALTNPERFLQTNNVLKHTNLMSVTDGACSVT